MTSAAQKTQKVSVNIPSSKMGKKKSVSILEGPTPDDSADPKYGDNTSADQGETMTTDSSAPRISGVSGRLVKPPVKLQNEAPRQKRSTSLQKARASKSDDVESNSSYHSDDDRSDGTSEDLTSKRSRGSDKREKSKATVESLHLAIEQLESLYEKERAKNKELRIKKAAARKENRKRSRNQTELRKEVKLWKERTQNERRSSANLQKTLAERDKYIEDAQEAVFSRIGKGATDTLDDNYIQDKFKELRMLWQNWTSEYAISSLEGIKSSAIKKVFQRALPSPLPKPERQQLYELFIKERAAPRMLLSILLSYSVCKTLLDDPFAFLGGAEDETKTGLERVLSHGTLRNSELTHAWRATTVKILNLGGSPAGHSVADQADSAKPLEKVRNEYYNWLAEKICDDGLLFLRDLDETQSSTCFEELVHIVQTTGDLSALLWAQKEHMEMRPFDIGMESEFTFSKHSRSLKAHPSMCLNRVHEYEGHRVQLVIEPAIYAFGNSDGKRYDQWKIRMPAIGWLSEDVLKRTDRNPATPTEDLHNTIADAGRLQDVVGSPAERPYKRSKYENDVISEQQYVLSLPKEVQAVDRLVASEGLVEDAKMEASSSNSPPNGSLSLSQANQYPVASLSAEDDPIPPPEEDDIFGKELIAHAVSGSSERQDDQTKTLQDFHRIGYLKEDENRVMEQEEGGGMPADRSSEVAASYDKLQHIEAGTFEVS